MTFTKDLILDIARTCNVPTGDAVLDGLFDAYNENSPHDDVPVYYRFLYRLSQRVRCLSMVELGLYHGGASLHFLKGGGLRSVGIDLHPRIDPAHVRGIKGFDVIEADSVSPEALAAIDYTPDVVFIDTDHSYDRTVREFDVWHGKVKPGGLMLFDDVCAPEFGCGKFFDELPGKKLWMPELHPDGWGCGVFFVEQK